MAFYQPGRYLVQVVDQGFGSSKQKLTPYFCLTVRPVARLVSADEQESLHNQYERYILLYLTDKTIESVVSRLRRLGWSGSSFRELDPTNDGHYSFEGAEFMATCEHEQMGEKSYERWRLPLGGGPRLHHTDETITRKLDARYGKMLKSTAKPKPAKKRKEAAVTADPSDSLPF